MRALPPPPPPRRGGRGLFWIRPPSDRSRGGSKRGMVLAGELGLICKAVLINSKRLFLSHRVDISSSPSCIP